MRAQELAEDTGVSHGRNLPHAERVGTASSLGRGHGPDQPSEKRLDPLQVKHRQGEKREPGRAGTMDSLALVQAEELGHVAVASRLPV